MESVQDKIESYIKRNKKTQVFLPVDFLDLGTRSAVDLALKRLTEKGTLRRYAQGLYGRPQYSDLLKTELLPTPEEIVAAIAKRENLIIQPSGATAANKLGLSLQVPGRMTYITNGTSRKLKVGNIQIELRRATTRSLIGAGKVDGLVIQALKYLGKEEITSEIISKLRSALKEEDKRSLQKNINYVPAWMRPAIQAIASVKGEK